MHMPGDVADLVKIFLRDLPEPLLTRALFPAFVAAGSKFVRACVRACANT